MMKRRYRGRHSLAGRTIAWMLGISADPPLTVLQIFQRVQYRSTLFEAAYFSRRYIMGVAA